MVLELDIHLLYQALTVALILIVTYVLGRIIARFFRETFKKAGIPETETIILASIVKYSAYLIGISIALGYLDIPTVSLWIALVLGVAVIGISARSALDNIVSGYFLRTYGPFDIGDVIEADGRVGAIKDLTLMMTVMETPEHLVYSVPNSRIVQSEVYNFTRHKSECPVELEVELSSNVDLEDVKLRILDIVSSYPRISYNKPVQIYLQQFTQRGLLLKILFFVPSFEIRLGARDFVASEIQKKAQEGDIPLAYSSPRRQTQKPSSQPEKGDRDRRNVAE